MMKKLIALIMAMTMMLSLTACGGSKDTNANGTKGDSAVQTDMEYVKEKGTLVVGITEFAPMDYRDENGDWIGFDADLAKKFAKHLGVGHGQRCRQQPQRS